MDIFSNFFEKYISEVEKKGWNYNTILNVFLSLFIILIIDINTRGMFSELVIDYLYIFPIILAGLISRKLGFMVSILTTITSFWVVPMIRNHGQNLGKYNRDIELWVIIFITALYFLLVLISNMLVEKTREARQNQKRLKETLLKTTSALSRALDSKDKYTGNHSSNVAQISSIIGKELGLSPKELYRLKRAAYLHDIGKIGITDMVLNKEGSLSTTEYNLIKQHSEIGYQILKDIPGLKKEAEAIRYHHERWDGSGYPAGLKGEEIPFWSRILTVADSFDAMISNRIYKDAMPIEEVVKELKRSARSQFDPKIVDAILASYNQGRTYFFGQLLVGNNNN